MVIEISSFPLIVIIGEHYNRDQDDQDVEEKDMSSSSLRRKLFFHGDIGTPLSPVRYVKTLTSSLQILVH